jgi:16S rRNA (uracil1498-N3)-methyltransferase
LPDAVPAFVWVDHEIAPGAALTLDASAAHHVVRVCRARVGDTVAVTDGRGGVARGRLARLTPAVVVEIQTVDRSERTATGVLLCGAPEGQRFDWLVEKLAELGVGRVRPVHCARGAWAPAAVRPERWRRLAVAAIEQSRSRFLLEIESPADLEDAVGAEGAPKLGLVADPEGAPAGGLVRQTGGSTVAVVGPAAGLTPEEKAGLRERGFLPVSFSGSRLRTETAAVAWAAWWAAPV